MARFQFPHVHIWGEPPETPASTSQQQMQDEQLNDGLQTPCNFLPQYLAPTMVVSSTIHRTKKSVDERAIRLLLPTQNRELDA
jgi:hypothetical protein